MATRLAPIALSLVALVPFAPGCTLSSERVTIAKGPESAQAYSTDGRVLAVERGAPDQPTSYVHIVIAVDGKEPVRVELAPGWYLDKKGLRFSEQDRVRVVGKREPRSGSAVMVAHQVQKGDQILDLRDDADHPAWED